MKAWSHKQKDKITKTKKNKDIESAMILAENNAPKRKLIEVSDQKTGVGLAELYERQYLQQVDEQSGNMTADQLVTTKQHEKCAKIKVNIKQKNTTYCHYFHI